MCVTRHLPEMTLLYDMPYGTTQCYLPPVRGDITIWHAIWNHTVLPATRQRWHYHMTCHMEPHSVTCHPPEVTLPYDMPCGTTLILLHSRPHPSQAGARPRRDARLSWRRVLYALRVLRAHGLCDSALHTIYRSVVVAKLLYALCAWQGFANATDRNKIQSFINKSKRNGYSSPDLPDFNNLCTSLKVDLFNKVLKIPIHVLHPLLPPPISHTQRYLFIYFVY